MKITQQHYEKAYQLGRRVCHAMLHTSRTALSIEALKHNVVASEATIH